MQTIREAQDFIKLYIDGKGVECPCCTQWVHRTKNPFHSGMARALLYIYRATLEGKGKEDGGFFHIENYFVDIGVKIKGVHSKLEHWGLLERGVNDDKKKKFSGYWRITDRGVRFVQGEIKVQKYARLFHKVCYGLVGEEITIRQALGVEFDYEKLMSGMNI